MKLSCVACRQKKIKCNRETPCQYCAKAGIQCAPQTRARGTRRVRKPTDKSVVDRLKQLEGIVSKLESGQGSQTHSEGNGLPAQNSLLRLSIVDGLERKSSEHEQQTPHYGDGRLVVKDGRTTYVTTGFWINMTEEIAELLQESDDSEDETDASDLPMDPNTAINPDSPIGEARAPGFILGFTSDSLTLKLLHPPGTQIRAIWKHVAENIRPVVKTIYFPNAAAIIARAAADISSLNDTEEAWYVRS